MNSNNYYFENQTFYNVYNAYNDNDSAFLFDNNNNISSLQQQQQQDLYHGDGYPFDNTKEALYDCTLLNDNFLCDSYSFLQDDNFSIATVSDFNNISTTTPLSTPSPQLSDLSANYSNPQFIQPLYNNQSDFLFAPIEESFHQYQILDHSKKSKSCSTTTTDTEKKHICPICNHRSKRKHNLVEHMLTHNPNRPKDFHCGFCSRPFARKYDMKRHEKIHTR